MTKGPYLSYYDGNIIEMDMSHLSRSSHFCYSCHCSYNNLYHLCFLVFHILEIPLSSSWYLLFIVSIYFYLFTYSFVGSGWPDRPVRKGPFQFYRTESELPFSKLLSKLVTLSMKRRFGPKQFSILRLDALHFSTGRPVRPVVSYGQRLTRALPVSRSHVIWSPDTPFSTSCFIDLTSNDALLVFSACRCNATGAYNSTRCERTSGQCDCKPGVTGRMCDRCMIQHTNFSSNGCDRKYLQMKFESSILWSSCITYICSMDVHWLITLLLITRYVIAASNYTLPFCMSVCFICAFVFVVVGLICLGWGLFCFRSWCLALLNNVGFYCGV